MSALRVNVECLWSHHNRPPTIKLTLKSSTDGSHRLPSAHHTVGTQCRLLNLRSKDLIRSKLYSHRILQDDDSATLPAGMFSVEVTSEQYIRAQCAVPLPGLPTPGPPEPPTNTKQAYRTYGKLATSVAAKQEDVDLPFTLHSVFRTRTFVDASPPIESDGFLTITPSSRTVAVSRLTRSGPFRSFGRSFQARLLCKCGYNHAVTRVSLQEGL